MGGVPDLLQEVYWVTLLNIPIYQYQTQLQERYNIVIISLLQLQDQSPFCLENMHTDSKKLQYTVFTSYMTNEILCDKAAFLTLFKMWHVIFSFHRDVNI